MTLAAARALAPAAAIDRYLPPATGLQRTSCMLLLLLLLSIDGTDGRTGGRTDIRLLHKRLPYISCGQRQKFSIRELFANFKTRLLTSTSS